MASLNSTDPLCGLVTLTISSRSESFSGTYVHHLIGETRSRYKEKVNTCCRMHPYSLHTGADSKSNAEAFSDISHGAIANYVVISADHMSLEQLKACKALGAHTYFTNSWVKAISAKERPSNKVVLFSESRHFEC